MKFVLECNNDGCSLCRAVSFVPGKYRMRYDRGTKKMVPELSYKYLISMSPLTAISSIEGLHVICGLNDFSDEVKSFYDKERTPKIEPFIDLVPLTATMPESDQVENVKHLLRHLL